MLQQCEVGAATSAVTKGLRRRQVNYINAHATSTLVGDVAELKAVKNVFTDTQHLKMNATKSMIGHCLGAAGGMEAVATIKAITTGWLHPTINHVRRALRLLHTSSLKAILQHTGCRTAM